MATREKEKRTLLNYIKHKYHKWIVTKDQPYELQKNICYDFCRLRNLAAGLIKSLSILFNVFYIPDQCRQSPKKTRHVKTLKVDAYTNYMKC